MCSRRQVDSPGREFLVSEYAVCGWNTQGRHAKRIERDTEFLPPGMAFGTTFQNIYAEGYPDDETRTMSESELLDYDARLAHFRRYSDPRYYKGVEYADVVESLARRRCAELFAANGFSPDQVYVNVQA